MISGTPILALLRWKSYTSNPQRLTMSIELPEVRIFAEQMQEALPLMPGRVETLTESFHA